MCNCEHDFDKLVPKYCHKYTNTDKIVLALVLHTILLAILC